jgi:very-short-patch-repair endonuclease
MTNVWPLRPEIMFVMWLMSFVGFSLVLRLLNGVVQHFAFRGITGFRSAPLIRRKAFLTRVEVETLQHLEALCPQFRVHAQVAMSALIAPARGLSANERLWTHRRYGQKVIDFVLQERSTGQVRALVELDDLTHNRWKDRDRDRITRAGGYPTVRLSALFRPTRASVAAALEGVLA